MFQNQGILLQKNIRTHCDMQLASSQHEGGHRQSHPYASGQIMQISFRCAAICSALCHPPSPLSKENLMSLGISQSIGNVK